LELWGRAGVGLHGLHWRTEAAWGGCQWGFTWPQRSIIKDGGTRMRRIPLWLPLLLVAVPTALLWWREWRVPPGRCSRCRYDLTGNESGVCPECGTAVDRRASADVTV
jgi:hypothetical protein